jgi:Protein of unknown function (DUF3048) N-terminal domain/Protein of unknown function (DUF3048) C-terminal domain
MTMALRGCRLPSPNVRRQRYGVVLLVVSLALHACSGEEKAKPSAGSPASATTGPPPLPANADPLTGMRSPTGPVARPALMVKIDNAPKGRPQAGINSADVVVEEGVEGGVTRFAALFHSRDATSVGPVRSARSTDISIAAALRRPLFSYSGTNAAFAELVRKAPLVDVGVGRFPTAYHREPGRPQTYNLFTSTEPLFRATQPDMAPPPPLFGYRPEGEGVSTTGSERAGRIQAQWRGRIITTVVYEWDQQAKGWSRTQNGTPHVDAAGARVAPQNVIFQLVNYHNTGLVDTSGAEVPEAELIGEGEAWVLTDGRLVKGRWSRLSHEVVTTYTDGSGASIGLTPGRTWIELVPIGNLKVL